MDYRRRPPERDFTTDFGAKMSDEEKEIILRLFPDADIGYDNTEQLIIYTGRYAENQMPEKD